MVNIKFYRRTPGQSVAPMRMSRWTAIKHEEEEAVSIFSFSGRDARDLFGVETEVEEEVRHHLNNIVRAKYILLLYLF